MAVPRTAAIIASSSIPTYARTAGRAVHIKIHPRPLNISESRHVLRRLEEYGEVIMYKHLKHEPEVRAPNTALAIFGTEEAASRAINASPLQFDVKGVVPREAAWDQPLEEEEPDDDLLSQQEDTVATTADRSASSPAPLAPQKPVNTASDSSQATQEFRLVISPSTQNHAAYISRQHYNGRFTLETRTIMGQDLEGRVPVPGLADLRWGVREVPLRIRNLRAEDEMNEGRGRWKRGLGEIWREGQGERERERAKS